MTTLSLRGTAPRAADPRPTTDHQDASQTPKKGAPAGQNAQAPVKTEWQQVYVWAGENRHAAKGRVVLQGQPGLEPGSKRLSGVKLGDPVVVGYQARQYQGPTRPDTDHRNPTQYPDSFTQGIVYDAMRRVTEKYDALGLGMENKEVSQNLSGKERVVAFSNSFRELNAFYNALTDTIHYGTAQLPNGERVDVAADPNVVVHERGHHEFQHLMPFTRGFDASAMREGFGDALSALMSRDPEMAEDLTEAVAGIGKQSSHGSHGYAEGFWNQGSSYDPTDFGMAAGTLRSAKNTATLEGTNAIDDPHLRGLVYSGFMWNLGEFFHEQLVGTPRNPETDAEALDPRAADLALAVLWTYPLYLGTQTPTSGDFVRAVNVAVDELEAGGRFSDAGINPVALKAFLVGEGQRRGLTHAGIPTQAPAGQGTFLRTEDADDALDRAVSELVLHDPTKGNKPILVREGVQVIVPEDEVIRVRLEPIQTLRGPKDLEGNQSEIRRFRVQIPVTVLGQKRYLPITGEVLTLVQDRRGYHHAQLGKLDDGGLLNASISLGDTTQSGGAMSFIRGLFSSDLSSSDKGESRLQLARRAILRTAQRDLTTWGPGHAKHALSGVPKEHVEVASQLLKDEQANPELVLNDGQPMLRLELGTLTYWQHVTEDGDLPEVSVERRSAS